MSRKISSMEKPERSGIVKTKGKELTMRVLIDSAGALIRKDGIFGLRINRIAKFAGKSRKLIYNYFGGIDGLIEAVINESDVWLSYEKHLADLVSIHSENSGKELASLLLKNHFHRFSSDTLLQELSLLELTSNYDFVKQSAQKREVFGAELIKITEEHFDKTDVDIAIVEALLIGGINYLVLHERNMKQRFCGIEVQNPDDQKKILRTLEQITKWAYENARRV